jgi:hypothetical protein
VRRNSSKGAVLPLVSRQQKEYIVTATLKNVIQMSSKIKKIHPNE